MYPCLLSGEKVGQPQDLREVDGQILHLPGAPSGFFAYQSWPRSLCYIPPWVLCLFT